MRVLDRRVVFEAFAAQTRLILTDLLTMSRFFDDVIAPT